MFPREPRRAAFEIVKVDEHEIVQVFEATQWTVCEQTRAAYRSQPFAEKLDRVCACIGFGAIAYRHVEIVTNEIADDVVGDDVYVHVGMLLLEAPKSRHEPQRRERERRGDAHALHGSGGRYFLCDVTELLQQRCELSVIQVTGFGENHRARASLE